jgi:hypothetical protein
VLGAIALVAGETERLRSAELPAFAAGDRPLVAVGAAGGGAREREGRGNREVNDRRERT